MRKYLAVLAAGIIGGVVGAGVMLYSQQFLHPHPASVRLGGHRIYTDEPDETPAFPGSDDAAARAVAGKAAAADPALARAGDPRSQFSNVEVVPVSLPSDAVQWDLMGASGQAPRVVDVRLLKLNPLRRSAGVTPISPEAFAARAKMKGASPDWRAAVSATKIERRPTKSRELPALQVGLALGDGFVAAEAKDAQAFADAVDAARAIALVMGADRDLQVRMAAPKRAGEYGDWRGAQHELDKARYAVKEWLTGLQSPADAELVELGLWVRGTEALITAYGTDDAGVAELLHQPLVIELFQHALQQHPNKLNSKAVSKAGRYLDLVTPLMGNDQTGPLEVQNVKELRTHLFEFAVEIRAGAL